MKTFILSILALSTFSLMAASFAPVMTNAQKRMVKSDPCARAALNAAVKMIAQEINDGIIAHPKSVKLVELKAQKRSKVYIVTFADDAPMEVQTSPAGKSCIASEPARIMSF